MVSTDPLGGPHAGPPAVRRADQARTWLRFVVLFAVVFGVAAIIAGTIFVGPVGALLGISMAAIVWAAAAVLHFTWLSTPRPTARTRRTESANGPVFEIELRPQLPWMAVAIGTGLLVGLTGLAGTIVLLDGPVFLVIALGLFALGGLYVIPDALRAATSTGRRAVIDATGLTYIGYSYETRIAWDDLAAVTPDYGSRYLPALRFGLRPGSKLTWTRRRWAAHIEPPPTPKQGPTQFKIPALVLDEPWGFFALANGLIETPAQHRPGYLASVGESMLTAPLRPPV